MPSIGYQTPRHAPGLKSNPAPLPAENVTRVSIPETVLAAAMLAEAKTKQMEKRFGGWPNQNGRPKIAEKAEKAIARVMAAMPSDGWITAQEMADRLGVKTQTARKWLKMACEDGKVESRVTSAQTNKLAYRRIGQK